MGQTRGPQVASSMFPLTRVPFVVPIFDPQPFGAAWVWLENRVQTGTLVMEQFNQRPEISRQSWVCFLGRQVPQV